MSPTSLQELATAVRARVGTVHALPCPVVVVGAQGLVLKTTSGKVGGYRGWERGWEATVWLGRVAT